MTLADQYIAATAEPSLLTPVNYHLQGETPLPRPSDKTMGYGIHRSGWSGCHRALSESGIRIAIDDFVEQTILHGPGAYHDRPFVGFFHYPPDNTVPAFAVDKHTCLYEHLFQAEAWRRSRAHLAAAVCLSDHLAEWLRPQLAVPVLVVRHPTDRTVPRWSPRLFAERPSLLQVGAFYRDTRAIARMALSIEKIRLLDLNTRWIDAWDRRVGEHAGPREWPADIRHINRVSDQEYDRLLSTSVVLTSFLAASASNVVVECIARATPLVVNGLPAVVEYLGDEYPLYLDRLASNPIDFRKQAVDAHLYLAGMNKDWLDFEFFAQDVAAQLRSVNIA